MFRLKIFVRVQTFRRRPFAASRIFCHPALKKAALVVGEHAEQVRNCQNFDITFWQFIHYFSHTIIFFSSAVPKSALGGPHIPDLSWLLLHQFTPPSPLTTPSNNQHTHNRPGHVELLRNTKSWKSLKQSYWPQMKTLPKSQRTRGRVLSSN